MEDLYKLAQYFNSLSDYLDSAGKLAGVGKHPGDIGTNREIICRNWLSKHLPKRLQVSLGGEVFSTSGDRSGQLDIIVANDISLAFEMNEKPFVPVEAVAAVISVKSKLTKSNLTDALRNLSTIPLVDREVLKLRSLPQEQTRNYFGHYPVRLIFAYDTAISAKTCVDTIMDFYNHDRDGTEVSPEEHIKAVAVNRKFLCTHFLLGGKSVFSESHFPNSKQNELRGMPLFWMTDHIGCAVGWLDHMVLDYGIYYDKCWEVAKQKNLSKQSKKKNKKRQPY